MAQTEILGTTKLTDRYRISLLKEVRQALERDGHTIEIGDQLVYRRENGRIVIEPA